MAYNTKFIKKDKSGINGVPQYFNETTDDYEVQKGENGQAYVKDKDVLSKLTDLETKINGLYDAFITNKDAGVLLTGTKVEEQLTETDAVTGTLTFSENITSIGIYNTDSTNNGFFTVNGIDIIVPAGEYFEANIGGTPSNTVTVSGATTYIVTRFE